MKSRGKEQYLARRLSFRELDFIDTIEAAVEHSHPDKFEFVNQLNYIGIKVKGSHFSPFLFKKPDNKLVFHYFNAETKTFKDIVIKNFDSSELDFVVNTIKERCSDNYQQNEDDVHFLEQASDEERGFLLGFKKTVGIMYPKTFSFVNANSYYGVRYAKQNKSLFLFKRKNSTLLFVSKSEYTLNQIVEIKDYSEEFLNRTIKLVTETLQLERNEQLVTANQLDDSTSSFPESLETERRRFVMSFKKIIEEHYPQYFDVFIDKKYLSFKEKKNNIPVFWFLNIKGKLQFQCHPKDDDTKSLTIVRSDKETLLLAIKMAKAASESYDIYAIGDKKQKESKREEKAQTIKSYKEPHIFSFIKNEILGLDYKALPSVKALCRNIKSFLLVTINQATNKNYENALECSEKELFFGKRLEWSAANWSRSAKVLYRYFKANTLVEKIKDYEETHDCIYIKNQPALLHHLFGSINDYTPIDFASDLYFNEPLPKNLVNSLNEILANFKGYESD